MNYYKLREYWNYKGPLAGDLYAALKEEIQSCVDDGTISNVRKKMNETVLSIADVYYNGARILEIEYMSDYKTRNVLRVTWTRDDAIRVEMRIYYNRSTNAWLFPIGDERVQINLNKSFRYWISNCYQYNFEDSMDSYLNSLPRRRTGSQFTYMPSSLQWPNSVQGTTSSQFQTNYLSPSSFINPYSSYYSYR